MRKLLMGFALLASVFFASGCVGTVTDRNATSPTTTEEHASTTTIAPTTSTTTTSSTSTTTSTTLPPTTTTTEPVPPTPETPDNGIIVQPDGRVDVPVDPNGDSLQQFLEYIAGLCEQFGPICEQPGYFGGSYWGGLPPSAYCDVWGRCYHSYDVWGNPYGMCNVWGDCTGGRDIFGNPWGYCDVYGCHEP